MLKPATTMLAMMALCGQLHADQALPALEPHRDSRAKPTGATAALAEVSANEYELYNLVIADYMRRPGAHVRSTRSPASPHWV
jgi:hypothetical protein